MEKINIHWNGPYKLDKVDYKEVTQNCGIYAIYRKHGNSVKLMYIGKTKRRFLDRLKEHKRDWFWVLRGELSIRVGIISFDEGKKSSKKKIADVESLLIQWCRPQENTMNMKLYYGRDLILTNTGRRGTIDKVISSENFE